MATGEKMKVLVTGANGQLGWDMILELKKRGHEPIATDILDSFEQDCEYIKLDITDEKTVHDVIAKTKPDASFTAPHGLRLTLPRTRKTSRRSMQ